MIDGRRPPRPAGPETNLRVLRTYVPVETWREVTRRAEAAGISVSRYLATLVERDQVDENGRPTWAPEREAQQQLLAS